MVPCWATGFVNPSAEIAAAFCTTVEIIIYFLPFTYITDTVIPNPDIFCINVGSVGYGSKPGIFICRTGENEN